MKYKNIIYICIAIIIAVFILYKFVGNTAQNNKATTQPQEQSTLSTQTNSEGAVTVKVTPENISSDKQQWRFRIILDAHSGSLDDDLTTGARITDEKGNEQSPLYWQGDPLGGHHREGILVFPVFQEKPKSVTLILQNVGGITERKFTWKDK